MRLWILSNCSHSTHCIQCTQCTSCAECEHCKHYTHCTQFTHCKHCTHCTHCTHCAQCTHCTQVVESEKTAKWQYTRYIVHTYCTHILYTPVYFNFCGNLYTRHCEELSTEIKKLREEVGWLRRVRSRGGATSHVVVDLLTQPLAKSTPDWSFTLGSKKFIPTDQCKFFVLTEKNMLTKFQLNLLSGYGYNLVFLFTVGIN